MNMVERWLDLMRELDFAPNLYTYDGLVTAYDHNSRSYHTMVHVKDMLNTLDYEFGPDPLVELAIWFHDAFQPCDGESGRCELDSATWAARFMDENGASHSDITTVFGLIMATKYPGEPQTFRQEMIMDIDLAILGSDRAKYARYVKQIRDEYSDVPDDLFEDSRRAFLKQMLKQQVYHTCLFKMQYESKAHANMRFELGVLHT